MTKLLLFIVCLSWLLVASCNFPQTQWWDGKVATPMFTYSPSPLVWSGEQDMAVSVVDETENSTQTGTQLSVSPWVWSGVRDSSIVPPVVPEVNKVQFIDKDYGFYINLPSSWRGYKTIIRDNNDGYKSRSIAFYLPTKSEAWSDEDGISWFWSIAQLHIIPRSSKEALIDSCQNDDICLHSISREIDTPIKDYIFMINVWHDSPEDADQYFTEYPSPSESQNTVRSMTLIHEFLSENIFPLPIQ